MYPNVRAGDILHIRACTVTESNKGDIALCRNRSGLLIAHRIIGHAAEQGKPCVITRADTRRQGQDAPVAAEDFLGVVTAIERKGKLLSPEYQHHTLFALSCLKTQLLVKELPLRCRWILNHLQRTIIYHKLAGNLLRICMDPSHWHYVVRLPMRVDRPGELFQPISLENFDLNQMGRQDRLPDTWILALHLHAKEPAAALAEFTLLPAERSRSASWCLTDQYIRLRYRGCGLRAELINRAKDIFKSCKITLPVQYQ
jgi:hypothetical protein